MTATFDQPPLRSSDILAGLTPDQHRAVTTEGSPLCILAGAGGGKTRVLTRRIAFRILTQKAAADHVLALTFTRKAAGELSNRLRALGVRDAVTAGTFHAVAAAQLRRFWADTGRLPPTLLESPGRLIGELASQRSGLSGVPVGELVTQLGWARARLMTPETFEGAMGSRQGSKGSTSSAVAALYSRYEDEKRRRRLVDFDDLLSQCADALDCDARFASAQRWRWRHLFVDEFQDVNPLQHRLLLALMGPDSDLCLVGDPNQAIYGWNGADPGLLDQVPVRWPSTEVVRLDQNHRCSPQVVAAGRAVLGAPGAALRSACPDGPLPTVRAYPSDAAEAAGVAAGLRQARSQGVPWSQMAVLVRTNAQSGPIRQAMVTAGIPLQAPGAQALLSHPAVVDVIDGLRRKPQLPVEMAAAEFADAAREALDGPEDGALVASGDRAPAAPGDRVLVAANLASVADLASDYARMDPRADVRGFLSWLPSAAGREAVRTTATEAVTISSFHRAKGLEWHSVWVCGLERGLVPFGQAATQAEEDEERRLLYVALTRAERELHCSWAARRSFGVQLVPRQPSPWLGAIGDDGQTEACGEVIDVETWRARFDDQRQRLRATGTPRGHRSGGRRGPRLPAPDPSITESLRAWRAEWSRAAGVPAHVLLHDRTLEALATLRPTCLDELIEVPGLGPVKAARFGPVLLALMSEQSATA